MSAVMTSAIAARTYRSKVVNIEAMQMPPAGTDPTGALVDFLHEMDEDWEGDEDHVIIHTTEGNMTARPGDWIIKGTSGEYYPCKNHVFQDRYERAIP